ncbi:DUF4291 domain-containing protein [Arenicella sp. 4NH20-0111]|uniref:DUF4291 domain-containing protein n=1 Tax=Arenicella sp. 4NH20-0111 TaxID=3127648 RepID=UPI003108DC35
MELKTKNYLEQLKEWPQSGKHILAQYTDEYVVAYQAYRPSIGKFAAENQYFGGDFSFSRMSWIKTNFLWMMYRSGWGTKVGQEITLALYLKRDYFEKILSSAHPSTNVHGMPKDEWDKQIAATNVRLQWDPDHDPHGAKQERKAIQLGLRKDFLEPFSGEGILNIVDISDFVSAQREFVQRNELHKLITPSEYCFPISEEQALNLNV